MTRGPVAVVLDPYPGVDDPFAVDAALLAQAGVGLEVPPDTAAGARAAEDADVVIVTGVRRLDAALISRLRQAVGIVCYSIGMDQVDRDAAAARSIPVRNIPGYCTDEVADHALLLLLAARRRLLPLAGRAAAGDWAILDDPHHDAIRRSRGTTLGIIGAGRIGRAVAARARAFGMRTIAADPYVTQSDAELPILPLDEVLAEADALVLCAALTPETRGILDARALGRVRPGLILVNVARGGLVDEAALADALADGRVAVAALDVRDPEPPVPGRDPLIGHVASGRLIVTPHMAASSREAVDDLHRMAAATVIELLRDAGRLPDPTADTDDPAA
jgi:D-3-phosphoglycerate dehydrogenase